MWFHYLIYYLKILLLSTSCILCECFKFETKWFIIRSLNISCSREILHFSISHLLLLNLLSEAIGWLFLYPTEDWWFRLGIVVHKWRRYLLEWIIFHLFKPLIFKFFRCLLSFKEGSFLLLLLLGILLLRWHHELILNILSWITRWNEVNCFIKIYAFHWSVPYTYCVVRDCTHE